jgi:phytoene synthase
MDLEASYAYAGQVARRAAKNFYYSFLCLPLAKRRSLWAVYAYSRRLDDAVDAIGALEGSAALRARTEVEHLRRFVAPDPPDDPLVPALVDTLGRFRIDPRFFDELVEGMLMDLSIRRYETFADLRLYCYRAASVIGRICLEIFGYRDATAWAPAEDLGIAMQLTNIIRDVGEDLSRDRIYLPLEDLRRFDVSESTLAAGPRDPRFVALLEFEAGRAREHFDRARALFPLVDDDARFCPVVLAGIYSRLLDRIESSGFDVVTRRQRVSTAKKLWIAWSAYRASRRGQIMNEVT